MSQEEKPQTKKFGKGERTVPHHSQKAKKWYPAEDEKQAKKVSSISCQRRREACLSGFELFFNPQEDSRRF